MEQFVDLCILCGCDYCESIKGTLSFRCVSLKGFFIQIYHLKLVELKRLCL